MLDFKAAKLRLRLREMEKDFTYLTRESDIKKVKFILSWLTKDGSVKDTTAPNHQPRATFIR